MPGNSVAAKILKDKDVFCAKVQVTRVIKVSNDTGCDYLLCEQMISREC